MVKKIVISILAIAVLIAVSVWGFMYYKRTQSFNIAVPATAVNAVRINVEQIGIDLLLSGGAETSGQKKSGKKEKYGLELPFNVFLFGLKDMPSGFLLSRWEISNNGDFQAFLKTSFDYKNGVFIHKSKLFSCIYNEKTVILMTSTRPDEKMLAAAKAYLSGLNTVALAESKWNNLRSTTDDISIVGDMGSGHLNFEKGRIRAHWTDTDTTKRGAVIAAPQDRALALHSGANLVTDLSGLLKERTDSVHWDRLQTVFSKGYTLYIKGAVSQQESVVTSDFDDNFEKVAKVSVQQKQVPGVYLHTTLASPESLTILQQESVITPPDSISKTIFPLFGLQYAVHNGGQFLVSSNISAADHKPETVADGGLYLSLWCNVDQIRTLPVFTDAAVYLKPFKTLQLQGRKNGSKNNYDVELIFTDQQKYALKQVLDLF
jgi:hypothetical protein